VCLSSTRCATLIPVKYFDCDDAKNAKVRKERGIGFEDIVFHIERGDLLDIRTPAVTRARTFWLSGARTTSTSCRSRLRPLLRRAGYGEVSPQRFARRRTTSTPSS